MAVGNPGQKVVLQVDTGSSDTWMNWAKSNFCSNPSNGCATYGTFDFEASSSVEFVTDESRNPLEFFVSYQDNAEARGRFVKDSFLIGGRSVKDVQFGLAAMTNVKIPVLGLGLPDDEVVVLLGTSSGYPNFVSTLFNDGLIKTTAYSLWLNQLQSASGTLLFGGVDHAKFSGKLASFPIQTSSKYKEFAVTMDNVALSDSSSRGGFQSISAVLDAGYTYSFLPSTIAQAVWQALKAIPNSTGTPYVQCGFAQSKLTLNFTFGSKTIKVPMSQLVFRNPDEKPLISKSGEELCTLGIIPTNDKVTLGITFLRSAYVVFDVKRREVSIAQAKYTSASYIQELGPGGVSALYNTGIPSINEVVDEDSNQLQDSFVTQNPLEVPVSPITPETEAYRTLEESSRQSSSSSNSLLDLPSASDFNLEKSEDADDRTQADAMASDTVDQF